VQVIGRILAIAVAVPLLAVGAVALATAYLPEQALVEMARGALLQVASQLASVEALGLPKELPERVETALAGVLLRYTLLPLGLVVLVVTLLPGRGAAKAGGGETEAFDARVVTDPRELRKTRKLASAVARKGDPAGAAEICFASGLMDEAANYFIAAEDFVRVAEIRHDQNRFLESAELYEKAGHYEAAGLAFGQQSEFQRAADCYVQAGNLGVAGEMFEKAKDFRRAANCYAKTGFARAAAEAYEKSDMWEQAATCFEEVILEERTGSAASDPRKEAEVRKLVRRAGQLYERAGRDAKAQAVLEKGECYVAAAEIALRHSREAKAADLFLRGKEPARAAEVLRSLGENETAARVMAEFHRDRGDEAQAARYFEEAGEYVDAGDLYRALEQFEKAGECYEQYGDAVQAAEMFRVVGDRARAGNNFERAGQFADAAECFALVGDEAKEAELLARAGEFLRAGEIHHCAGNDDEAISLLQQVEAEHPDFALASALLGEIFRERGMLSVALTKLKAATDGQELSRENLRAFYGLATVCEANQNIREACDLYEKILACDYHFQDVEERLGRIREILHSQTPPTKMAAEVAAAQSGGVSTQEGRYRITGTLGRGGMGIVYKANDTVLDRTVALKVLPETLKENPQALKNFLREAKSAAQLNHPGIVTVYDAGEQDGVFYIAMEYVDGNTLKTIVKKKGKISPPGIVHVLAQMCEALAFAHEKKIVHRDIKTANTMWTSDRKAKIMDFGLAKAIEEVRNHTTVVSGTPYYMSPEQTLGKNVDHRTDIYSLGVTTFELATGTLPFCEGNLPYHHVHTPPPDPSGLVPDLPPVLVGIINRCLEKDPASRFQSAREILAELKQSLIR
jgi:tetratricopeptide (TPR) repeat protein